KELAGMNYRQYTSEHTAKILYQIFHLLYETGKPSLLQDYEIIMKDGTSCIHELSTALIRDSSGRPVGFRGLSRDITRRKKAEEALKQASLVVENSPAVLFRWRAAQGWPVELVSNNVVQFGYQPEDFLSGKVLYGSIIHQDDIERVTDEVQKYSKGNVAQFRQEYRIVTHSGDVRWVDDRTTLGKNADGHITHYQGIVIDITEQKHAEETLQESEQRYRFLAERMNDVIWMADLELKIKYISPSIEKITGYTPEEFQHKDLQELLTPESYTRAINILAEELGHEGNIGIDPARSVMIDLEYLRKDSSKVWMELLVSAIRDNTGMITGIHGVSRDITEYRNAAMEREHLVDRLRKALADVKTLSGLVPICANCKKIRDDKGYWNQIESYISEHSNAVFTHGICPECAKRLYPDYKDK
ncbi:MAG: PAS domain S-box protein, partial [Deltaproteobacteria bacterium]|nr:PAS domain S-box protein [Deltaproteobacteria bacterium]